MFGIGLVKVKWVSRLDPLDWNSLVGKPKGKTPPGRPRRRWKDSVKVVLK
jgi:hypothetical protein